MVRDRVSAHHKKGGGMDYTSSLPILLLLDDLRDARAAIHFGDARNAGGNR